MKDLFMASNEVAAVQWTYKQEFAKHEDGTNVFLAAFTTSYARLKLYGELSKLGRDVLYFDTDSIVYKSTATNDPALGDYLGDFTNELDDDDFITTFVSGNFFI